MRLVYMAGACVICFGATYALGKTLPLSVALPMSLLVAIVISTITAVMANEEEPLS